MQQIWKIRRKSDGRFMGAKPSYSFSARNWTKRGRVFTGLNHLKTHVRYAVCDYHECQTEYFGVPFSDVEAVGFSLGEAGETIIPFEDIIRGFEKIHS